MRNIYFIICFVLSVGTIGYFSPFLDLNFGSSSAGSTSYAVEIAQFKYPVYTDYFEKLEGVIELSGDGVFHYVSGITKSKKEAEDLSEKIRGMGYEEAKVIDLLEEFSEEDLAGVVDLEAQDQKVQQKESAKQAIAKLSDIDNAYFYTILLKESKEILTADQFAPLKPKAHKQGDQFYYLYGRFEDVGNAQKYLEDKIRKDYASAQLVVINKGTLMHASKAKPASATTASASNNMGRKMRGKEYVDYYYELSTTSFAKTPLYYIEVGPYNDKTEADEAVRKLHDLGFTKAGIKDPSKEKRSVTKPDAAADAHYTIQIFAGRNKVKTERFKIDGVSQSYDQNDKLYRYFVGDYDNYWVCRRELREVRKQGFRDAFIVKL
ncbi:SPOR domain-containing protein [Marinifilum caeruleilacunae]|uniref:SPOR domain-containing protein n=1 Tax=Marinifilum caeruleilacunae TaxID=2499076 RepID=A0ABX1WSY7_9BACT|nr:SPOR domain-containing protein [Marinifilum caeruleilacunae]NOU59215.1 SPOR domain-containing protein [Marinifilum caeruleilacunae]